MRPGDVAAWLASLYAEKLTTTQLRAITTVAAGVLAGADRVPVSAEVLAEAAGVVPETAAAALRRLVRRGLLRLDRGADGSFGFGPGALHHDDRGDGRPS